MTPVWERPIGITALVFLSVYFFATASVGWGVGRAIYEAKLNPIAAIASSMVGRDSTEQFMIVRMQVPQIVTISPAFWLALRLSE